VSRTPIRRLRGSVNCVPTLSFRKSGLVAVALGLAMTPNGFVEFGCARRPPSPLQSALEIPAQWPSDVRL
jgi:hypothetical protein